MNHDVSFFTMTGRIIKAAVKRLNLIPSAVGIAIQRWGEKISIENQHQLTAGYFFVLPIPLLLSDFKELLIGLIAAPTRIFLNTSCKAANLTAI